MIEIEPIKRCDATVRAPASKSFTHRALVVSALADGESTLSNPLLCDDTRYTISALKTLGVSVIRDSDKLRVKGKAGRLEPLAERLFVGNSGTTMRLVVALSALIRGRMVVDGTERMRQRPIGALIEALGTIGVNAYSVQRPGFPPVVVESKGIEGGCVKIRAGESSQFLSALLLIAPYARGDVKIKVVGNVSSRPYVEMTLQVMRDFGVKMEQEGEDTFIVPRGQCYRARHYAIDGDASSASYFFAAAAITGGRVRVEGVSARSKQGDLRFLDILEAMGCKVARGENWAEVRGGSLRGIEIDMNETPDLVPTLAVTAAFARGRTVIKNIGHLRFKESDRVSSVAAELRKIGVNVGHGEDWLMIESRDLRGATIDPRDDHRLAMAFSIAGLMIPGIRIRNETCVNKSFPGFWDCLKGLY